MAHRPVGRTGLTVNPIAFGAFKIGRNQKTKYAQGYALPDEAEVSRLLNGVLDLGINLIDTAPAYGVSEERIGRALYGRRDEYLLSTKVGENFENGRSAYDFSREGIVGSIRRSLLRLQTGAVDFLFLHSDGRDLHILNETDAVATLLELRRQGLARFIGLSGKTVEGARAALGWADVLMVEYHPDDVSHEPLLAEAAAAGVGLFVKKPLSAGRLSPNVAIPFGLRRTEISTLVIGSLSLDHLRANLEIGLGGGVRGSEQTFSRNRKQPGR